MASRRPPPSPGAFSLASVRLLWAPQAPRVGSRPAGVADPASAAPVTTHRRAFAGAAAALAAILPGVPAAAQDPGLDLGKYKGKVVYLDFWASWCGPCKLSFPYMNRLAQTHAGDDLVVLAVDLDRARAPADLFLSQVKNRLPIVYDPTGREAKRFQVKAMPTSLLIGRDGRVRYVHDGFFAAQVPAYEAQIAELLREKP